MTVSHIIIDFQDMATARRNCDRIESAIARTDDDVRLRGPYCHVATTRPRDFVAAYLDDGFDYEIRINP